MNSIQDVVDAVLRWIGRVAETIAEGRECFRPRRHVQILEQQDGTFLLREALPGEDAAAQGLVLKITDGRAETPDASKAADVLRGAQADIVLQPRRSLVRQLELPRRASEFLDGIVRAQIDRLTPWTAANAAFGWHPSPTDAGGERLAVTIAATARPAIEPLANAVAGLGAGLIRVYAALQEPLPDTAIIMIYERKAAREEELRRTRRILTGLFATAAFAALVSVAASIYAGGAFQSRRDDVTARLAELRAKLQPGPDAPSEAAAGLERRKHEAPSSVIVIEALSRILPDDTYLTELRIAGSKLQIIGLTRDASALIRLIEQTPYFREATFFSPTTRTPAETLEHFSIEAQIQPVYTPGL